MTTVLNVLQKRKRITPTKGDLGIEIEVEGRNLPMMTEFWANERDGSLQGESMEYVLLRPSTLEECQKALRYMELMFKKSESVVEEALRAGVHVHVNCQHLTIKQLYCFMTLYLTFENVLVKYCGSRREGNLFCLRAKDADYLVDVICKASEDPRRLLSYFHTDDLRYAAMNVKALGDYGSLEFRTMRSTPNLSVVYTWAEILLNMRKYVEDNVSRPSQLIERFSLDGPEVLFEEVFGKHSEMLQNLYETEELFRRDLYEGMRYAQDVAYCVEDWETFDANVRLVNGVPIDPDNENEPEEDF